MQVKLIGLIFAILCLHQASAQLGSTDKITDDLTVFIGGNQTPSSGPAGNHVTMYNLQEAAWSSFNWGCNGVVRQIKVVDESIYLAGDFDQCDNTFYGPLVKYDIPSGEFSSLLPDGAYWMNAYDETTQSFGDPISVRDFQLYKGKLYIVGLFAINFTATNELASNVAAVDIRTGQWKTFGAGLNGRVNSLWVQDEKTLLLVGRFTRSGYGETFNPDDFFTDIGFAVWHEDHFRYGTGYMSYTIPVSYNNFDLEFGFDNSTEIFAIWRGVIQVYPNGDNLNVPLPNPSFFQSPSAGATVEGIWRKPDGDLLYVCVVEPNSDTDATVVASLGKNRYYEGDAYSVTAEGIEYFTSYSSPDTNSRDTSTLNYWGASSKVQGLALFRRVSETLLEETWVQVLPNRYKWSDLNVNNCTPETCQLADRGSNAVIYDYVGPVTLSQCSQANSLRGRRPGSTIADPTD